MRRSRSSSNIPCLTSLQTRDSKGRERARSIVRNSREHSLEGVTPLAPYRYHPGGTDRKYSFQKKQLRTPTTPSNFTGFKRSSNLNSAGSSKVSVTRSIKSSAEKKTLQKQQYFKVQEFILSSGLVNPELATKIRPPTITIFVELASVLLRQIIKTAPITLKNYVEVIVENLKLLRYPGQITTSVFKTVNTMHGWPHFLAIIYWLIEKVNLVSNYNAFKEEQDEDVKATFNMHDAVYEFLTSCYNNLSENCPEDNALSEQRLYEKMLKIIGTDQETALKLNVCLESERREVANIESKLQEIEEENLQINAQNLERQNIIDRYEESKGNREKEVKDELVHLKKELAKCLENKTALVEKIKELEDCISKQSCQFEEKTDMLNQIEDLKRAIERKNRTLTEYRMVRDDLDMQLRTLIMEIESKVDAWKVSTTKTFLPELKTLRIREKGFHSKDFLEEIKDVRKKQEEVQEKLLKEFKETQSEMENLMQQKEFLIQNDKAGESNKRKLVELRHSVQLLEAQNRNIREDLENCTADHERKIKIMEQQENSKIKDQERRIEDINERKQKLTAEFCKKAQTNLAVIIEAYRLAIQNIRKIEDAICSMVTKAKTCAGQSFENLQESLDHLKSLRETTTKLYQALNNDEEEDNEENRVSNLP